LPKINNLSVLCYVSTLAVKDREECDTLNEAGDINGNLSKVNVFLNLLASLERHIVNILRKQLVNFTVISFSEGP